MKQNVSNDITKVRLLASSPVNSSARLVGTVGGAFTFVLIHASTDQVPQPKIKCKIFSSNVNEIQRNFNDEYKIETSSQKAKNIVENISTCVNKHLSARHPTSKLRRPPS